MAIRLKPGVLLSVGLSHQPVDLVNSATGDRLPLSAEESAVAMLLTDGVADLDELRQLGRRHQVDWDEATMEALLRQLLDAGLVEEYVPEVPTLPDTVLEVEEEEEEQTHYDPRFHPGDLTEEELLDEAAGVDLDQLFLGQSGGGARQEQGAAAPPPRGAAPAPGPPAPAPRPAPQPTFPHTTGEIALRPLAMVAVLVRDGKYAEANQLVDSVLAERPDDEQALAMRDMIVALSGSARSGGRSWTWGVIGALLFLCVGAAVAGLLIKVPAKRTVSCSLKPLKPSEIRTQAAGKLVALPAAVGQVVQRGAVVARVADVQAKRRLGVLRARKPLLERLLRTMRTGGSDTDESWAKLEAHRLGEVLRKLDSCGDGPDCASQLEQAKWALAKVKQISRFCVWQALAKEIKAVEQELATVTAELKQLEQRTVDVAIKAETGGLVREVAKVGTVVKPGDRLARLVAADRFQADAKLTGGPAVKAGSTAVVRVEGQGVTEAYRGTLGAVASGGAVQVLIKADVAKVRFDGTCHLILPDGKISLARHLFKR